MRIISHHIIRDVERMRVRVRTAVVRLVGAVSTVTQAITDLVNTHTLVSRHTAPLVRPALRAINYT